ncbi:thiolase domain-containing protein [Nocardioides sp. zg-536]|uniref:Thiolase domain-containing protein n=1 Tax=Nocardioides faecalis TaxID=2803858 RepID=A0A938Y805_9ACTN|nr:thiolase domain-containing protein [Nocardioides faecalis]MBM9458914.1 thiolase domain-containing protein [Nocardioides faecalis]MBS4753990.1 thiolase domain-containing protein [Nocardioides faecalis]QVI60315.1 thiolase domain-containing protein [Nocardioides faecalis]
MRDVAVVGFAQRQIKDYDGSPQCAELLVPLFAECYEQTGWTRKDIGFWCSGSSDYLAGRSFSFVSAIDAIGVLPPVNESHVEMDAAWALYEAWLKIQTGEVDTALVFGFGKASAGVLRRTLSLQLDPYTMTPLWPDTVSLAALQARLGIDAGLWDEAAMAEVVNRSLTDAEKNEFAIRSGGSSVAELLSRPMFADPLRKHDAAPVTDGAAAIVLAAGDRAREVRERPAWITGLAHYTEGLHLGTRDLTRSDSAERAAAAVGGTAGVEVAELHAPFSHQELILRRALGLAGDVQVNPSGGPLAGNPMFTGGAIRIGEAARRIWDGSADKTLATATSGPALQQNLVCVLEGSN